MKYKIEMDESDENFDRNALNILINHNKVQCSFYDLQDFLSVLVNEKFYDESMYKYDETSNKTFIELDWVEQRVRSIYDNFSFLSDYR